MPTRVDKRLDLIGRGLREEWRDLADFPLPEHRKRQSYPQKGWVVVGTPGGMAGFTWAAPFPHPPTDWRG